MIAVVLPGHLCNVGSVALSQDNNNRLVVSGDRMGTIIVHSTKTGIVEYRADNVFRYNVSGLCCLPNGSLVACGYDGDGGNGLKVFSPSLELVQTLEGHDNAVECVTVSPSGSYFASGDEDGKVMIWSEPGEGGEFTRVQVLEDHTKKFIFAVCFSPDGKQLATGSFDKSINLYSFNEGSAILAHTLEGHTDYVKSLSFSPDCKLLCSGSVDRSIKFWNPADGSLVKSIDQAHTSRSVRSVSYSPNGRILVSAGGYRDKTMKIWDAETFELKHTFEQEFYTNQLAITADSNFIVSANTDNTVRFTPCREYHLTGLTPILNLILHIVYKWKFVSFLESNENISPLEKVMRRLGECVHDGGYNVTSEILSFLSPANLPVQITPTPNHLLVQILEMQRVITAQKEKLAAQDKELQDFRGKYLQFEEGTRYNPINPETDKSVKRKSMVVVALEESDMALKKVKIEKNDVSEELLNVRDDYQYMINHSNNQSDKIDNLNAQLKAK